MESNGILFILGSGASVDSGLSTYRGLNSINGSIVENTDNIYEHWNKNEWLIERLNEIKDEPISETYSLIQAIIDKTGPNSTIMTQNIDGLVHQVKGANNIELHGTVRKSICENCGNIEGMKLKNDDKKCIKCSKMLRPDIIRIGDNLKVDYKKAAKKKYDYILIIGTTLQFPYLRWIIGKAKQYGAKVIHINPDPHYTDSKIEPFRRYVDITYKKTCNIRRKERMITKTSSEGLIDFYNEISC